LIGFLASLLVQRGFNELNLSLRWKRLPWPAARVTIVIWPELAESLVGRSTCFVETTHWEGDLSLAGYGPDKLNLGRQ
jgi:hypothetical protein